MFQKKQVVVAVAAVLVAGSASAASLLDAGMTTALSTGFTDLQDTIKGILVVAWPFIIGIAALLAAPSVVKKLISLARS